MDKVSRVFSDSSIVDLFVGFPVQNYETSLEWYNQLLGCSPAFFPNEFEAVWELAEHRYFFIKVLPELAGHTLDLVFLSNFDDFINHVTERGINPTSKETLSNGVRKIIYNDPDGNEIGFGGSPIRR